MPTVVEVVCPDDAAAGSTISVATDHGSFDVVVPDGVEPGQAFTLELPDVPVEQPADAAPEHPDGYGGLGVVAEQLEEAHRVAAEFFNTDGSPLDMRDLKPGAAEVLAAALRQLGHAVDDASCGEELDEFIWKHCHAFAEWKGIDGEQDLRWTPLHKEYSALAEGAIAETLAELSCSAEQVFAYAEVHGGDQTVDKAMTRLLALAEYRHFCEMMHRYSEEEELASGMRVMGM